MTETCDSPLPGQLPQVPVIPVAFSAGVPAQQPWLPGPEGVKLSCGA